jgi:tetrathionate reductase subunit B
MIRKPNALSRRRFLGALGGTSLLLAGWRELRAATTGTESLQSDATAAAAPTYDWLDHEYGMLVDLERCIGCGFCVAACKRENNVPYEPIFFRTWVERYVFKSHGEVEVDSPNGAISGFPNDIPADQIFRSFFVPKLCNHCERPPCVQVCPVGATYATKEGVVLVDRKYCIGCRYCIEACPYGARYLHPEIHVADKCTFCYHRIVRGLRPACVETCPRKVRIFGDRKDPESRLAKLLRRRSIQVLKPTLNTEPRVYYLNLDKEVR